MVELPLKFDRVWLQVLAFNKMVIDYWSKEENDGEQVAWIKFATKYIASKPLLKNYKNRK